MLILAQILHCSAWQCFFLWNSLILNIRLLSVSWAILMKDSCAGRSIICLLAATSHSFPKISIWLRIQENRCLLQNVWSARVDNKFHSKSLLFPVFLRRYDDIKRNSPYGRHKSFVSKCYKSNHLNRLLHNKSLAGDEIEKFVMGGWKYSKMFSILQFKTNTL